MKKEYICFEENGVSFEGFYFCNTQKKTAKCGLFVLTKRIL